MFRAGVAEPLRDFYSARKFLMVLDGLVLVALVILLFYCASEKYGFSLIPYYVIGIFQSVFTLAVVIWQVIVLNELKSYEERFGKVILYILLGSVFSVISAFAKNNFGLVVVFSLLKTAIDIWAYYHLCGAFSDLTRPWDDGISDEWSILFSLYVVIQVSSFFVHIFISMDNNYWSDGIHFILLSCLVAVAGVARFIYELVHIKKTIGVFERTRYSVEGELKKGSGGDGHEMQQL